MKIAVIGSRTLTVRNLENIFRKIQQKSFREVQMELTDVQRNLQ